MVDLGPYEEPVEFAWAEASKLKHEFVRAANLLDAQMAPRKGLADRARSDWRGAYARRFERNDAKIIQTDAARMSAEFTVCAEMLSQLADLARQEKARRAVALKWKADHDAWVEEQRERSAGEKFLDWGLGDDEPKPPQIPEIKPKDYVATAPPPSDRG